MKIKGLKNKEALIGMIRKGYFECGILVRRSVAERKRDAHIATEREGGGTSVGFWCYNCAGERGARLEGPL